MGFAFFVAAVLTAGPAFVTRRHFVVFSFVGLARQSNPQGREAGAGGAQIGMLHRLTISGGPAWTSFSWGGAVALDNSAAIAWQHNASNQSFAFDLGEDDKHTATVDADGVALAAIQGLYQIVREKDRQLQQLQLRVQELERQVQAK